MREAVTAEPGTAARLRSGLALPAMLRRALATLGRLDPVIPGMVLVTLLLTEWPLALAWQQQAHGLHFVGMLWSPHDASPYLSAIRESAAGPGWLVHNHLTAEPHAPAAVYPLYIALGKLVAVTRVDPLAAFHAVGTIARLLLPLAIAFLAAAALPGWVERRWALGLALFAAGPSLWLLPALRLADLPNPGLAEESTLLYLFGPPHLLLALGCLLLGVGLYLRLLREPGRVSAPTLTGLAGLVGVLALLNPFSLVTLNAALALHVGWLALRTGRLARGPAAALGVVAAVSAPFVVYNLAVYGRDPFWGVAYGEQNRLPTPPPPALALSLGALLVAALPAAAVIWRRPAAPLAAVGVFGVAALGVSYLPVSFQGRLGFGVVPLLAIAAAPAIAALYGRTSARGSAALGCAGTRVGLAVACCLGSLLFLGSLVGSVAQPRPVPGGFGGFQPERTVAVGAWLAARTGPDDVVLAELGVANYLASVVPGRVYVGHPIATLRYAEKVAALRRFAAHRPEEAEAMRRWLIESSIGYVVWEVDAADGAGPPLLRALPRLYSVDGLGVYRVEPAAATTSGEGG